MLFHVDTADARTARTLLQYCVKESEYTNYFAAKSNFLHLFIFGRAQHDHHDHWLRHCKYLNNTLPTSKNLYKWSLSDSPSCSFCLHPETLQHVVSSCKSCLEDGRYTWHHNSVLLHIANSFSSLQRCRLFVDLPSFPSPSLITGDSLRPDLALISPDNTLYILELTVGFETNIEVNNKRKAIKYGPLIQDLRSQYRTITFINLSMSALGIYEASSDTILNMMNDLGIAKSVQISIIKKIMNIAVRSTYYIFCRRNKAWTDPALLHF